MTRRTAQNKPVSKTVKNILAERNIALNGSSAQASAARAIVYLAGSDEAHREAVAYRDRYGGELIAAGSQLPYPANAAAAAARQTLETLYGMSAPLAEPETAAETLAASETVTIVTPLWGKHLPAPIATFLARHDLGHRYVEARLLADGDAIAPVVYRELCANLPSGSSVHVTALGGADALGLVAGCGSALTCGNTAAECAPMEAQLAA